MIVQETAPGTLGVEDAAPPRLKRRLSEILGDMAADPGRLRISVGDLFAAMGDRAFGPLLLIFALPNVFPTPPGTSAILGAPLVFLTAQLMLGRAPWLPRLIADRSMTRADFGSIVARISPWLMRAERLLKPRLTFLVYPPAEYLIGLLALILAVVLALPIPLGNILPALAICFFSFGILERDGVCVLIGLAISALSAVVAGGVVYALVKGVFMVLAASFA